MKIKLSEIVNTFELLIELAKVKMPIKASYQISRLLKKVAPEFDTYNEKRNELLKEFGKPQENGQSFLIAKENIESFNEQIKKLYDIEIEIEFTKIKIEDLGEINIEPKLLIDWIFE